MPPLPRKGRDTGVAVEADAGYRVTGRGFARFYAPLAATSLLLTGTDPILMMMLARTTDPVLALAAYFVGFSVCGVLYAPMLAMQQVAAARLLNGGALAPVKRFAYASGAVLSAAGALIAYTSAGDWVFLGAVGVGEDVAREAMRAMAFFWPVPFLTAVRATHQGRLVAGHRTKPIGWATGARTGVLTVVALILATLGGGAWLGAAAFTAGLVVETVIVMGSRASTPAPAAASKAKAEPAAAGLGGESLGRFSVPLMANVLLWWATPLIINAVLARTPDPESALAAFGVVQAVGWFVASPVGQLQHASIALVQCSETHARVRLWGGLVALSMTGVLLLLTAVREPFLRALYALDSHLLALAGPALAIAALYPVLYGWRQYYQGLFVRAGTTWVVGAGACGRVVAILAAAFVLRLLDAQGAVLGAGLMVLGLGFEGLFLSRLSRSRVMPGLRARAQAAVKPEVFEGAAEASR